MVRMGAGMVQPCASSSSPTQAKQSSEPGTQYQPSHTSAPAGPHVHHHDPTMPSSSSNELDVYQHSSIQTIYQAPSTNSVHQPNSSSSIYQDTSFLRKYPHNSCSNLYQRTGTCDRYALTGGCYSINGSVCKCGHNCSRTGEMCSKVCPVNCRQESYSSPQNNSVDTRLDSHNSYKGQDHRNVGGFYPTQEADTPRNFYQKHEGKVVIRPIAYRPAAPSPAQLAQGFSCPTGPIAGVGGRPPHDPRYTSTPALARGGAPHYGSLGDLKSMGYSLDRRGFGTPLSHGAVPTSESSHPQQSSVGHHHTKHTSMTHLHHSSDFTAHHNTKNTLAPINPNVSIYSNTITNGSNLNQSCDSGNVSSSTTNYNSNTTSPNRSSDNSVSNGGGCSLDSSHIPASPARVGNQQPHKSPSDGRSSHDSSLSPQPCQTLQSNCNNNSTVNSNHLLNVHQSQSRDDNPNTHQHHHHHHHHHHLQQQQQLQQLQERRQQQQSCGQITQRPTDVEDSNITNNNNISTHNNISNFESLKNLTTSSASSSDTTTSHALTSHQHHYHHLHHHHHRMGGSVSNLTRIGSSGGGVAVSSNGGGGTGSSIVLDRSASVTGANITLTRAGDSINGSMTELDDPHQTPSPSDSGVAELEAILKEKDSEIIHLKESMEQSEQIIFKVYEEKERNWERELKKIRELYEGRLKAGQQKAATVEQSLLAQAYQVQQERRKVSSEAVEARRDHQQLQAQLSALKTQLEETEWGLCQKSGEISLLKSQLKDCQGDQTSRGHELLHLRAQLRQYAQEVERRRTEIASLHELTATLRKEATELRAQRCSSGGDSKPTDTDTIQQLRKAVQELQLLREERTREREHVAGERSRWQQEKESVLRYQRQLQLACTNAQRTNRRLHQEISRLQGGPQPAASLTPPPTVPPLPPGYAQPPSPPPPPPGVLSEEALC